ncbi:MAG TPA: ester cyclase [Labilithrix sp.]|jgi:predicted SnoaL-like aldol condensation-catalyzing enzyme
MTEDNIALVRRYFEMWNTGEGAIAGDILAPSYVDHTQPHTIGPAAARSLVPRFHAANPELRMAIDVVAAGHDFVAVRNTIRREGSDAPIAMESFVLFRIEGGKLAEQWTFDAMPFAMRGAGPSARQVWQSARRGRAEGRVVVHETLDRELIVVEVGDDRMEVVRVVDGRIAQLREFAAATR